MKNRMTLILLLMCVLIKSFGQEINISNTKDLLSISKSEGLISAIANFDFVPIHYIDRETTQELLKQTLNQPYSEEIESFLVELSDFDDLPELIKPLNNLIRIKTNWTRNDSTSKYDKINIDLLKSTLIYNNEQTEYLLIDYYKTWLKLAKKNRANYINGKSDSLKYNYEKLNVDSANRIYDLMLPYKICNYNCYAIMLTLKKMNSNFVINKSLEYHKKIGEGGDLSNEITKREKLILFKDKTPKIIALNKDYRTIKDIDFYNEPIFRNLYLNDTKISYNIYGFYNQKSGIINICHDNICDYYLVKLIGDRKLNIYETTMCSITTE